MVESRIRRISPALARFEMDVNDGAKLMPRAEFRRLGMVLKPIWQ
jgi:hypothetical protein